MYENIQKKLLNYSKRLEQALNYINKKYILEYSIIYSIFLFLFLSRRPRTRINLN